MSRAPWKRQRQLKKHTHGTRNCYDNGCRCPLCRAAMSELHRNLYLARRANAANSQPANDSLGTAEESDEASRAISNR